MKFSYQKYPANPNMAFPERKRALRPVIPIGVVGKDKNVYHYEALIDSGADHNIFHAEIGGHRHKIYCGFVYSFKNLAYGILGQDDFFKLYAVEFDLKKERLELKSRYNK